jgi:riboflavin biosynthesis pyrimidine reductase
VRAMRQLLPVPLEPVDLYDAYRPDRTAPATLRVNMVSSVDGAVTDEHGSSDGLGDAADHEVFRVLRAHADAILVGAGTARAEGYGPHRLGRDLAARRRSDGWPDPAPIVVASRSLALDPATSLFTAARTPTVVLTCAAAPADRRARLARVARVLVAGDEDVDLPGGLALLQSELGAAHVLSEGGPSLNRELFAAGLVDELCLTVAPVLVNGGGPRLATELPGRVSLALGAAYEQGSELLLRYTVVR